MEGTIAEWLVGKGDQVSKGDPIVELETDKVNVEVHSDFTGVIAEITSEEGTDVEVGDVIGQIDEGAEAGASRSDDEPEEKETAKAEEKSETKDEKQADKPADTSVNSQDVIASPAARKRARELDIDLSEISPRDPLGRIRPEDVEDRKSTRLNSSHVANSYAVFCLKKKNRMSEATVILL